MKKITLFCFLLLIIFATLPSSVSAQGICDLLGGLLCTILGLLVNILKSLLGKVPNLGDIDYEQLAKDIKTLNDMGIKITEQELVQIAKEIAAINLLADGFWKATLNLQSLLPHDRQLILNGALPAEENGGDDETKIELPVEGEDDEGDDGEGDSVAKREARFKRATCTYRTEFDARTNWPGCNPIINNVVNQGQCGSCWAVSSASAFTDCNCIARAKRGLSTPNNEYNTRSAFDVLTCSMKNGCGGGWPDQAFKWMKNTGVCTGTDYSTRRGCKPYPFQPYGDPQTAPACVNRCTANWGTSYPNDKQKVVKTGTLRGEQAIINQLKAGGPVVVCFTAYSDFMGYKEGVYSKTGNPVNKGGHAVVVVGYGTQTCGSVSKKYWIIRNSWGTGWGQKGFVFFRRGVNECNIENEGSYGTP